MTSTLHKLVLFVVLLLMSTAALAADSKAGRQTASDNALEVDSLIACGDGSDIREAAKDLNEEINSRGLLVFTYMRGGISDGDRSILIKRPFKVSAPAMYQVGRSVSMCVTITK